MDELGPYWLCIKNLKYYKLYSMKKIILQVLWNFHGSWMQLFNWITVHLIAIMVLLRSQDNQEYCHTHWSVNDLFSLRSPPLMYQSFCFDCNISSMPIEMWLHRWLFLHKQQKLQECLPRLVEPVARREVDTFPIPSRSSLLCCFRFFPFFLPKQNRREVYIWRHQTQVTLLEALYKDFTTWASIKLLSCNSPAGAVTLWIFTISRLIC